MIGIWSGHAQTFMLVFAILALVAFIIPMIFAPMFWARMLLWNIPATGSSRKPSPRRVGLEYSHQ